LLSNSSTWEPARRGDGPQGGSRDSLAAERTLLAWISARPSVLAFVLAFIGLAMAIYLLAPR